MGVGMSFTYLYTCDICGTKKTGIELIEKDSLNFVGIHFIGNTFELGHPQESGRHICEKCWKRLKELTKEN